MNNIDGTVGRTIRSILLELARREDDLAAAVAAKVAYWQPRPASAIGHHAAALALRSEADRFLDAVALPWGA